MHGLRYGVSRLTRRFKTENNIFDSNVKEIPSNLSYLVEEIGRQVTENNSVNSRLLYQVLVVLKPQQFSGKRKQVRKYKLMLLDLWDHSLKLLRFNSLSSETKHFARRIVKQLINRKEFCFPVVSSSRDLLQKRQLDQCDPNAESLNEEDWIQYWKLRYRKTLEETLVYASELATGLRQRFPTARCSEYDFCVCVLAVSFFRIPPLQTKILSLMEPILATRKWRHPQKRLSAQLRRRAVPVNSCSTLFRETNPSFFKWYTIEPAVHQENNNQEPEELPIVDFLIENANFFAAFVRAYCEHVQLIGMGHIRWEKLPGYTCLQQLSLALVVEACWRHWEDIKFIEDSDGVQRPVPKVPNEISGPKLIDLQHEMIPNVLRSLTALLHDPGMIERFINGILQASCGHNPYSVSLLFSTIEQWITSRRSIEAKMLDEKPEEDDVHQYTFPDDMNTSQLERAMELLIQSQHSDIIQKTLLFQYRHYDTFPSHLQGTVHRLWAQEFYHLFLHWNSDVRSLFQYNLVYNGFRPNRILMISLDELVNTDSLFVPECVNGDVKQCVSLEPRYLEYWKRYDRLILTVMDRYKQTSIDAVDIESEIPAECAPYAKASLGHYADILEQYYRPVLDASPWCSITKPEIRTDY